MVAGGPGEGDEELYQALGKYGDRVVIGFNINVGKTDRGEFSELLFPPETILPPFGTGSPVEDSCLGYVNISPEDGRP